MSSRNGVLGCVIILTVSLIVGSMLRINADAIREASLEALYSLTAGFPEIIDEMGWIMIHQAVE